jgi:hypothetical protein
MTVLSLIKVLATGALLLNGLQSKPSGAPICHISLKAVQDGHGQNPKDAGYSLSAQPDGKGGFDIQIQNAQLTEFKGVLMYVTGAQAPDEHLGSFDALPSAFKFSGSTCTAEGTKAAPQSTFTHANPSAKPISSGKFNWTPNSGDEAKGGWTVSAVISNGQNPYQVLQLPLEMSQSNNQQSSTMMNNMSTSSANLPASSSQVSSSVAPSSQTQVASANTPQVRKTFKCRRIRSVHRAQTGRNGPSMAAVNNFTPASSSSQVLPNKVSEFHRLANEIRAEAMMKYPHLKDTEAIQKYVADMLAESSKKKSSQQQQRPVSAMSAPKPQTAGKEKAGVESLRSRSDFFGAF